MRQQMTVYLEDENRHWLQRQSKQTGIGMSTLMNMFVTKERQADSSYIGNVNRSLENARVADLENEEV